MKKKLHSKVYGFNQNLKVFRTFAKHMGLRVCKVENPYMKVKRKISISYKSGVHEYYRSVC